MRKILQSLLFLNNQMYLDIFDFEFNEIENSFFVSLIFTCYY